MVQPKAIVDLYLVYVREALCKNKYTFVDRAENMRTLAELGLLIRDAMNALTQLSYDDYISGPETDRDFPETDDLWIFKIVLDSHLIYVKLKLQLQADMSVKVLSFHFDNPNKKQRRNT